MFYVRRFLRNCVVGKWRLHPLALAKADGQLAETAAAGRNIGGVLKHHHHHHHASFLKLSIKQVVCSWAWECVETEVAEASAAAGRPTGILVTQAPDAQNKLHISWQYCYTPSVYGREVDLLKKVPSKSQATQHITANLRHASQRVRRERPRLLLVALQ
jgi:hypothetical protein